MSNLTVTGELVWDRLTQPANIPQLTNPSSFNEDGTEAYVDVYGNDDCVHYFRLLVPYDITTAIYKHTMENFY